MIRLVVLGWAMAGALTVSGCGGADVRPYTYRDNKEMTGKPGLFTGGRSEVPVLRE